MPREVIEWAVNLTGNASTEADKLRSRAERLDGAITMVAGSVTAAVAALTAAAVSFKELGDYISSVHDNMVTLAEGTGFAVETVNAMRLAARAAGKELEDFFPRDLPERMVAATEAGSEQQRVFAKLGVEVTDAEDKLRSVDDVFRDLIDSLVTHHDRTEASGLAMKLMGDKGQELFTAFGEGSKTLDEFNAKARAFGIDTSQESIALSTEWIAANSQLTLSFEILGNAIYTAVGPSAVNWVTNLSQNIVFLAALLRETNALASDIRDTDLSWAAVQRAAGVAVEFREGFGGGAQDEFVGPPLLVGSGGGTGMARPGTPGGGGAGGSGGSGAGSALDDMTTKEQADFMKKLAEAAAGQLGDTGLSSQEQAAMKRLFPEFDTWTPIFDEQTGLAQRQLTVSEGILKSIENGLMGSDPATILAGMIAPAFGPVAGLMMGFLGTATEGIAAALGLDQDPEVTRETPEERKARRERNKELRRDNRGNGNFWTRGGVNSHARGTPYVPETGLAMLHRGERVMTEEENKRTQAGGRRGYGGAQIHIHNPTNARQLAEMIQREKGHYGLNISLDPVEE